MNTRSKTKKSQKHGNNIETYTFKNKVHPMITRYKLLKEYSIFDIEFDHIHNLQVNNSDNSIYILESYLQNNLSQYQKNFNYIQETVNNRSHYLYETLLLSKIYENKNSFIFDISNYLFNNNFIKPFYDYFNFYTFFPRRNSNTCWYS